MAVVKGWEGAVSCRLLCIRPRQECMKTFLSNMLMLMIHDVKKSFNTRTAEQLIYLQQPRASIDASLLNMASLRLTDAVGLQHTATARP